MLSNLTKNNIVTEIRQTVKYLMREREKGNEKFDIADFYKKELEDELLLDYDNKITRGEYKKIIADLFGIVEEVKKKSNISKAKVKREIEKLVKQYRMKSKKQILQKLLETLKPGSEDLGLIKEVIDDIYIKIMKDPITKKIISLVKSGTTKLRMVMSLLKREGYDVESEFVEAVIQKAVMDIEKRKSKYSRSRRPAAKKFDLAKPDSAVKDRLKKQMKKSLLQKTRYNKQRFLRKECPSFKFAQTNSSQDGNERTLVFSGTANGAILNMKSFLKMNRITDVQIYVNKGKSKKIPSLMLSQYINVIGTPKETAFIEKWIKDSNKHIGYSTQELIWFLAQISNNKFGLPDGLSNYLSSRFVKNLNNLDKSITEFVVSKAIENV